jgi:hypothetical protein
MTAPSNPNPEVKVEASADPNPQPQVQTSTPPHSDTQKPSNFDPESFFSTLDTKLKGFGEQLTSSIKEAFPPPEKAVPPATQTVTATSAENASTPTESTSTAKPAKDPQPGRKTFAQWWFNQ